MLWRSTETWRGRQSRGEVGRVVAMSIGSWHHRESGGVVRRVVASLLWMSDHPEDRAIQIDNLRMFGERPDWFASVLHHWCASCIVRNQQGRQGSSSEPWRFWESRSIVRIGQYLRRSALSSGMLRCRQGCLDVVRGA